MAGGGRVWGLKRRLKSRAETRRRGEWRAIAERAYRRAFAFRVNERGWRSHREHREYKGGRGILCELCTLGKNSGEEMEGRRVEKRRFGKLMVDGMGGRRA